MDLKITTLIENNQDNDKRLFYEHGLSLYIEADNKKILFDTGQTGDFIKNARLLKKSLDDLDYVILSHGHYDHSGGVKKLLNHLNRNTKFIMGKEYFYPKYKKIEKDEYKFNGNSFDENYLISRGFSIKKEDSDIEFLTKKIILFHNFNTFTNYEKINKKFFIKKQNEFIPDDFKDEMAMGIITQKGLVVIVGCSHIGIINILKSIKERININIYAVIGGTHMIEADDITIDNTISDFKKLKINSIAVSHCTGEKAIEKIKDIFSENFIINNTGNIIKI